MGEEKHLFRPEFNGSIRVEARAERLTSEAGAVLVREAMDRLRLGSVLDGLGDPRKKHLVTHPLNELVRTELLLLAQGWRDEDDSDALRDDPALRLSVSNRRGISPLEMRPRVEGVELDHNPAVPDGLASQPTLSRLTTTILATEANRAVLGDALFTCALRRIQAERLTARRKRSITVDIDSLPIEVHGHQPGSEHNGHYHARVYHPLIAGIGETGDLLAVKLRPGNAHTADGGLEFALPLLERLEAEMCQIAAVRMDAGFPEEGILAAFEARGTPYVARVKNNKILNAMAEGYLCRPPGRRPAAPREWVYEMDYAAKSWSRSRRVVLVVQERPDELFIHHFWLITNWTMDQISAEDLLAMYRQRGTAEAHWGEFKSVLDPALSSSPRTKSHYRDNALEARTSPCDSFAANEVRLLLNALAYNLVHVIRTLVQDATGHGWSLLRVRERILRVAARVLSHGRRAIFIVNVAAARLWESLWSRLRRLREPVSA